MFQVSAQIESVSTRKDRTLKIVVGAQELRPEQVTELMLLNQLQGWFMFKEDHLVDEDIPEEKPEFKNDKSPSQRMRSTLYVYWENCTNKNPDFNTFYSRWMEKKIDEIKALLP